MHDLTLCECTFAYVVAHWLFVFAPVSPPRRDRSIYNFLTKFPLPTEESAGLADDALTSTASNTATAVFKAIPLTPKSEDGGVEFVGASGCGAVPVVQQPGARGLRMTSGFGLAAPSSAVSIGAHSFCSDSSSNRGSYSIGSIEVGTGGSAVPATAAPAPVPAAAAAEPTMASAEHDTSSGRREAGSAQLPLLSSAPSASSPSAPGEAAKGLGLLEASELEEANALGRLDAIDAFLGEAVLEGFGEHVSNEEDLLSFLQEGNI